MKQKAADMALIRQRLEKLERENRRLRRGLAAVTLGLGASLALGFSSAPGLRPTLGFGMGRGGGTARQPHSVGPPGAAEQFVLRDSQGVIRARLDAGGRTLAFFDDHGAPGGTLTLETADSADISRDRSIQALSSAAPAQTDPASRLPGGARQSPAAAPQPVIHRDPFDYAAAPAGLRMARAPDRAPPPLRLHLPIEPQSQTLIAQSEAPQGLTGVLPTPPAPTTEASGAAALPATVSNPPAAALVSVTLKVVGYIETPGEPEAVVVSDGPEVHVVHQGEVFDERFQVVRVSSGSADIRDMASQETLTLPINP